MFLSVLSCRKMYELLNLSVLRMLVQAMVEGRSHTRWVRARMSADPGWTTTPQFLTDLITRHHALSRDA